MRTSSLLKNNFNPLRHTPFFACLTENEIQIIESASYNKCYLKNTVIINEGDETGSLYIVMEGSANALSINSNGKQIILNVFRPGDYFGEMSFIDAEPRSAAVITREKSKITIIKKKVFDQIIADNPKIMLNIMKGLVGKIRRATKQIEDLVFSDVYSRIAGLLIELKNQEDLVSEKLTNTEIAFRVGSSREMVSRIITELKNGGYIEKKNGYITIKKTLPYHF